MEARQENDVVEETDPDKNRHREPKNQNQIKKPSQNAQSKVAVVEKIRPDRLRGSPDSKCCRYKTLETKKHSQKERERGLRGGGGPPPLKQQRPKDQQRQTKAERARERDAALGFEYLRNFNYLSTQNEATKVAT